MYAGSGKSETGKSMNSRVDQKSVVINRSLASKQRGGALVTVMLFIFAGIAALIVIKAFPFVYDGFAVQDVFTEMAEDSELKQNLSKRNVKKYFDKRMVVNQIKYIRSDKLTFENNKTGGYIVTLNYDYLVPLVQASEEKVDKVIDFGLTLSFRNQVSLTGKRQSEE